MANCPNLKKYASMLGKDYVWDNKIFVSNLSYSDIQKDL
jgi:hypothetical protein